MSQEKRKVTHAGTLPLAGFKIPCYVLEDGTRILSGRGLQDSLKILPPSDKSAEQRGGGEIKRFLNAKWFRSLIVNEEELVHFEPISCWLGNQKINGYEATVLADICDLVLQARSAGMLNTDRQYAIADQCEILIRGFAKVGIIALVDEATGYQDVRMKDALQKIFEAILLEEAKKYQVTFPLELYKQWFRLNNWEWKPENAQKRPGVIGKWTNDYIYDRIAPDLSKELSKRNPKNEKGYREHKHFQFFNDNIGEPKLREFFGGLIALAKASPNWRKYVELIQRAYPKPGDQTNLDFGD